jgi:diadenosine tetraphosphate (Ap4A) HIT family hydrolase
MQEQPHWRKLLLRTEESAAKYEKEIAERGDDASCALCLFETVVKEYEHWFLMTNKYPYDRYFTKSDMLVSKRHVPEQDLTKAELDEMRELIRSDLSTDYDSIIEHMPLQKSIPEHTHMHLVQYKRPDGLPR